MRRALAPCPLCAILLASAVAGAGCAATSEHASGAATEPARAPAAQDAPASAEAGLVHVTIVARGLE